MMFESEEQQRAFERSQELKARAFAILKLVVAEWESDPRSVQCFDLKIVEEAVKLVQDLKEPNDFN